MRTRHAPYPDKDSLTRALSQQPRGSVLHLPAGRRFIRVELGPLRWGHADSTAHTAYRPDGEAVSLSTRALVQFLWECRADFNHDRICFAPAAG